MADRSTRLEPTGALTCRIREGTGTFGPGVLLLHGFSGDEDAMWVFGEALPSACTIISPRALYPLALGGFTWVNPAVDTWPAWSDFNPALEALHAGLADRQGNPESPDAGWIVVGFSQGAALAFAAAAGKSLPVVGVASLAGFLPEGGEPDTLSALRGLPVYWAHGTQDEFVPIARAREGIARLTDAGSRVTACEAEVGHRLGPECMRGLRSWFAAEIGA